MTDARRALGEFLRAHRELVRPEDVGLPVGPRRRTPGLRREEVAAMAGVGVAWYTWLEQGRVTASRQVLESVARVLRLDDDAVRHVLTLAGLAAPAPAAPLAPELVSSIRTLLDSWPTSPAVLLDDHFDMLAWNDAYRALWGDPADIPEPRRNLMWVMAADPRARALLREWEPLAMTVFQQFRGQASVTDVRTSEVYALLERDRPDLTHWWQCPSVSTLTMREATADTAAGPVTLLFSLVRPVDDPRALVLLQTPASPADRDRMRELLDLRE
ncbi:transcriptional regulator [Microbispora rosea subsp. aerata]|nr:helix-turn-helix domain-containing protein [Microbispora rosea]GGO22669.1 transcriptional regulator [Microbispora rosea subsp. aerata]GIH58253.1 transcriptional regulator [Microbispora rosea subsp. aerata]GLJ86919.1 transcriptional regulator [Microbispora rosea subsp. aerata]